MGKLIVSEFMSLDGVIEAPENWHFPYISEDMAAYSEAQIHATDSLLLGRVTYDIFASFWPSQTHNEFGIADKLNSQPKFVVSSTLKKAEWNNSTLLSGNPVEEITRLKQQQAGNIGITGSATLVQSLLEAGLIDEYQLMIHPIILGSGQRLFKDGLDTTALKLVETRTFQSGVIVLTYQLAGKAEPK